MFHRRQSGLIVPHNELVVPPMVPALSQQRHPWSLARGFSRRRCCCGCNYFEDSFDREDNTDIGDSWTEVSGEWSIDDNSLVTSDSNAIVLCNSEPDEIPYVIQVWIPDYTSGQHRIIFDYQDSDNYKFFQAGSDNNLRLYERIGGTNTLRQTTTWYGGLAIQVFPDAAHASSRIRNVSSDFTVLWGPCYAVTTTRKAWGLGSGSGPVSFNDVSIQRVAEQQSGCPVPPTCCGNCEFGPNDRYLLEIAGIANGSCGTCSGLNGSFEVVTGAVPTPPLAGYTLAGNACAALYQFPSVVCTYFELLTMRAVASSTDTQIWVDYWRKATSFPGPTYSWSYIVTIWKHTTAPQDCRAWDELSIPLFAPNGLDIYGCDASSSTCKVTSL